MESIQEIQTGYEVLLKSIRKSRNTKLIWAAVFLLIGLALLFANKDIPQATINLGVTFCALTALLLYKAIKDWNPFNTKLMKLIRDKKKIVWVYHIITESTPYGVKTIDNTAIYFNLIDGKLETLSIKKRDVLFALKYLQSVLTHTSFGYSVDKEQLYRVNPTMLIQD